MIKGNAVLLKNIHKVSELLKRNVINIKII
jgi:hypothetical protein